MSATRASTPLHARSRLLRALCAMTLAMASLVPLTLVAPEAAEAAPFTPGAQTRFPLPDASAQPAAIVAGGDGALWVAESAGGAITRMTTDGRTTRIPLPVTGGPTDLAVAPDGAVWWASSLSSMAGRIAADGTTTARALPGQPTGIVIAPGGGAWLSLRSGISDLAYLAPDPAVPAESFDVYAPVADAADVTIVGSSLWVSFPDANIVVTANLGGVAGAAISTPAPTELAEVRGEGLIVSATSRVELWSESRGLKRVISDRADFPLISGVAGVTADEVWYSQIRGRQTTVASTVPGMPEADLPLGGEVSDVTIGPDGAAWATVVAPAAVVRIARDYVAPGVVSNPRTQPAPLRAYLGEPLGPFSLSNRGSGTVKVELMGSLPAGLAVDADDPARVLGAPTTEGSTRIAVRLSNTYYGGLTATVNYQRSVDVRARPHVRRLGGADRYAVAVSAARESFPRGAATVYLASGEKFPDALSAGALAIEKGAPLLLSTAGALPAGTRDELARLDPSTVVLVGGPATLSEHVLAAAARATKPGTSVQRIGGADRYEVSRNLVAGADLSAKSLYLATGRNYPDALSAAPMSAQIHAPVLLVDGSAPTLADADLNLIGVRGITSVRIAGGPNSVSPGIENQLRAAGVTVTRLGGTDRYAASATINRDVFRAAAGSDGLPTDPVPLVDVYTVYLASGEVFPDALAGGVAAGGARSPLYAVHRDCVPRAVLLDIGSADTRDVVLLGGPNTLTAAVEALTPCP